MSLAILFGKQAKGKIGELTIDATLSENHDFNNSVSQYPVEDGSSLSDNIRVNPDELTITGIISNTPVDNISSPSGALGAVAQGVFNTVKGTPYKNEGRSQVPNNLEVALTTLLRISGRTVNGGRTTPEIITVVTGLRVYTSAALSNLVFTRDPRTGSSLRFTGKFTIIKKVASETQILPKPKEEVLNKTGQTVDKSVVKTKKPKEQEEKLISIAKKGVNKIFSK